MNDLSKVRKAIQIQGYIDVSVAGKMMQCHAIKVVCGKWCTDILTRDMCGYVRILATKPDVVSRAEYVIAHSAEITATRKAESDAAMRWAMQS